jgi:signal transduction histidine kinase
VPGAAAAYFFAARARASATKLSRKALIRSNASLAELNARLQAQVLLLEDTARQGHAFVDDVAHELRTPLTVIKEFTSIIADGLGGPVTEQQAEWLRTIDVATVDLDRMVEGFLDTSKLRARLLRIDRRPHDVKDILVAVRRMLARKVHVRSITLVEELSPGLPAVFADGEMVRRIILNLACNAIKSSRDGSELRLLARELDSGDVEIAVRDQGPGLSPADKALFVERFQHLPDVLAPSVKGFGLGLNLARQLVWLNLGRMGLASEPGQGATFSFTLPPNEPCAIVDRFLERLGEREMPGASIAALRVTIRGPNESFDATRRFLAATTRPSDVIVETSDASALILCGAADSPVGWMQRLRAAWEQSDAAGSAGLELSLLGAWAYPGGAGEARACLRSHVSAEPARV